MTQQATENLISVRKKLHAIPELAMEEKQTARFVADFLKDCSPDEILENVGETGVLAIWDSGREGPTVMLRSELDALPIQEINDFEHRSPKENVSHKCGHDGHTTILLGVAQQLKERPPQTGRVGLLFQPGEETGQGAVAVLADQRFQNFKPTHVFALHNLPGYPMGMVVKKEGGFTAAVKSLIVRLQGKTSHAAEPEFGINPALAVADILRLEQKLAHPELDHPEFFLITPVYVHLGDTAYGISAGYAEVHLTIRTWTEDVMANHSGELLKHIQEIAIQHKLECDLEWTHVFQTNRNNDVCLSIVEEVAKESNIELLDREYPFKFGEDFGAFTQKFPGAMFGLGSGERSPALHNPDYDFPDDLLPTGIKMMEGIVRKLTD